MWRILVVDDSHIDRRLVTEILKGKALCDTGSNGREALEAYDRSLENNEPYDLILVDMSMPEVDGLEFLRRVRARESFHGVQGVRRVPIIVTSSEKDKYNMAFDLGCDGYVFKPFNGNLLLKEIENKLK